MNGYVVAGYAIPALAISLYAVRITVRVRRLRRDLRAASGTSGATTASGARAADVPVRL